MVAKNFQFICGAMSGPVFVGTTLILGVMRAHYSQLRYPVSMLALGSSGWVQVTNFLITGILVLVFALGLWRHYRTSRVMTLSAMLIVLLALTIIGAGVFPTDGISAQLHGPASLTWHHTLHGQLHRVFASTGFFVLPMSSFAMACQFCRWRQNGWALYSLISGISSLVFCWLTRSSTQRRLPVTPVCMNVFRL